MPLSAVVFDYGGVLTTPVRDSIEAWIEKDRIDPASFSRTLKAWLGRNAPDGTPIHRLETGEVTIAEFNELIAAELRTRDGSPVNPRGLLGRLFAQMSPEPEMYKLAQELRDQGVGVAILSNSWGNTYPRAELEALFDPIVISAEVGLRKPHAAIFELTLSRLGVPAGEVAFVDDAGPNVRGAEATGMNGIEHRSASETRRQLSNWVPELVPHADEPSGVGDH